MKGRTRNILAGVVCLISLGVGYAIGETLQRRPSQGYELAQPARLTRDNGQVGDLLPGSRTCDSNCKYSPLEVEGMEGNTQDTGEEGYTLPVPLMP